jgi:hypothetical protein
VFELRIQTGEAARNGATDGRPIEVFDEYIQAVSALDRNQTALDGHLATNREGASLLAFSQVVVDVSADPEVGWLWSTYRPGGLRARAAPVE